MIKKADFVLKSNAVFSSTNEDVFKGGVAIAGNRIVAVGSDKEINQWIGLETKVFEYGDELIMPGFNDSHFHLPDASLFNNENYCLDLSACHSEEDCVTLVEEFAKKHPENAWIYGMGWNYWMWNNPVMPTRRSLDKINMDKPICLSAFDLHSTWVNKKALEVIGIDRNTPDPEVGSIWKFEDGEPSGLLSEKDACMMATTPALTVPIGQLKASIITLLKKANQFGITTIGDVFPRSVAKENAYDIFQSLDDEGNLSARIMFFPELKKDLTEAKKLKERFTSAKVRFCGLKQLADGVVEAHTAFMVEPYSDDPSTRGEMVIPAELLREEIINADKEGISVRIHTIGDGTVRHCLNCIEEAQKLNGKKGLRHALEHIENIQANDIPRLSELGVVASMQPLHCISNVEGYPVLVGEERVQRSWAIKTIINSGARYSFGTDAPVVDMNPFLSIHAGVTRTTPKGYPEGGFNPKEKISIAEVLKGYTTGAAYVENFDDQLGTLEVGKLADIIVLSKNLFAIPTDEILKTTVKLTILDGKVVHEE